MISTSYQQTIEDSNCFVCNKIKIFYLDTIGYYWIFPRNPKKNEINVGIGIFRKTKLNLKNLLNNFKEKYNIEGKVNYVTGGLIPIGLQRPLIYKNVLFVGDSGVGTFPSTGQGIYRALVSGDIAGVCIVNQMTKKYPHLIYKRFLRWDLIGKTLLKNNLILKRINPKLVLSSLYYFQRFCDWII
jgi:flavin-dependent dehydrogenase